MDKLTKEQLVRQQRRDQAYEVYEAATRKACEAYRVMIGPAYQTLRETLDALGREASLEGSRLVAKAQSSE